jgi:3-methyladenine DNA glycosylase AlkC
MKITYAWTVDRIQVTLDDLIVSLTVVGADQDSKLTALSQNEKKLDKSNYSIQSLTEQQVLDWCFASDDNLKSAAELYVAQQIQNQLDRQTAEIALPWQIEKSVA